MTLRRALVVASVLALAGLSEAVAQFPPPPAQQASPFPPPAGQSSQPGQSSPFPSPGPARPVAAPPANSSPFPPANAAPPPGGNPCQAFIPLREDAEKAAGAIKAAGERKAPREEVCPLFQRFAAAEAKTVKFLETHQTQCGVPGEAIKQVKANHAKTLALRTQVCRPGPGPGAPSLSDALSGPPPTETKPGRGTFDTLTGSPLAR